MRTCGPCTACCTVPQIEDFSPPYEPCPHLLDLPEHRCAIYEYRPSDCRLFRCAWLRGWGEESDRPDLSGTMYVATPLGLEAHPLDQQEKGRCLTNP